MVEGVVSAVGGVAVGGEESEAGGVESEVGGAVVEVGGVGGVQCTFLSFFS